MKRIAKILTILALGAIFTSCVPLNLLFDGSKDRDTDDSVQISMVSYIGLTVEEAQDLAKRIGDPFRVVKEDGVDLPVTFDYRPGRINAEVEDGIVVDFEIEGMEDLADGDDDEMVYDQDSWKYIVAPSCTSFSDGCNTCTKSDTSDAIACTERACFQYDRPKCLDEEKKYDAQSWQNMIPDSCTSFFDGCNTCQKEAGSDLAACTRKYCAEYEKPECLDGNVLPTNPDEVEALGEDTEKTVYDCEGGNTFVLFEGEYYVADARVPLDDNQVALSDEQTRTTYMLTEKDSSVGYTDGKMTLKKNDGDMVVMENGAVLYSGCEERERE